MRHEILVVAVTTAPDFMCIPARNGPTASIGGATASPVPWRRAKSLEAMRVARSGTRINSSFIAYWKPLNPSLLDLIRDEATHAFAVRCANRCLGILRRRGKEGYANSDGVKCRAFSRPFQKLDRFGKRMVRIDGQSAQLVPSREALHARTWPEMP